MSNTIPVVPVPPPKPSVPPWLTVVMAILTGIAGLFAGRGSVGPTPSPAPVPNGGGQVNPSPQPIPNPQPVPDGGGKGVIPSPSPNPAPLPPPNPSPQPNPQPLPPTPVTTVISVTDSAGRQVTGSVDAGSLFMVSVPAGVSVMGILQPTAASGDVSEVSTTQLACTLKAGGSLQVVSYATGSKPTMMMVTCNTSPQPPPVPPTPLPTPPNPSPTPQPTPDPQPAPASKNVSIAIVEDDSNRSPDVAKLFSNLTSWENLANAGVTWTRYDLRDPSSTASMAKQGLTAAGVTVNNATTGYVIYDRDTKAVLYSGKLVSLDDVKSHVQAITGRSI